MAIVSLTEGTSFVEFPMAHPHLRQLPAQVLAACWMRGTFFFAENVDF